MILMNMKKYVKKNVVKSYFYQFSSFFSDFLTNLAKIMKNLEKWQFKKLFLGTYLHIYDYQSTINHIYHLYSKNRLYSEKKFERNYEKKHKVCKKQQKWWIYLNKKWPPTPILIYIFHLSSLLNLYAAKKYIILSYWI